jgi:hypothetical protein
MVQIIAAIKRSTKTANIESPPFYCQRLFILERNLHHLAEILKLDFRKLSSEKAMRTSPTTLQWGDDLRVDDYRLKA